MIDLVNLSQSELQYMHSKWTSQKTELEKDRARKLERVTSRLNNQEEEATAQAEVETSLAHAQTVKDELINASADQSVIDAQQEVIDSLQAEVDGFSLSSTYVSNTDARIAQMELDELEFAINQRSSQITEIEGLLAA